jgi:hypothetical protein
MSKLNRGRTIMYADDTTILNVGKYLEELETAISTNTSRVIHYFESNNSYTNFNKTNFITFHTKKSKFLCKKEFYK